MKKVLFTFVLMMFFAFQSSAFSATIYSNSSTGNDATGNGTSGNPYKTFAKGYSMLNSGDILDLSGTFTWSDADETLDVALTGVSINMSITIQGPTNGLAIIQPVSSGTADRRSFTIGAGFTVALKNLEIRYGYLSDGNDGGGVMTEGTLGNLPTLNIENCYFHHNKARQGYAVYANNAYVNISGSTIAYNSYSPTGSGTATGAISINQGSELFTGLRITNSTVYGNTGASYGGGLAAGYGTHYITNCTFANNQCNLEGGGISIAGNATIKGKIYIKNSIIANNISTTTNYHDYDDYYGGETHDNGSNIVEYYYSETTPFTGISTLTGNQATINLAADIATNGTVYGPPTLALLTGSVAIDRGNSGANQGVSIPTTDQRGFARTSTLDAGSFEFNGIAPIVAPAITSATYNATNGALVVTGTNIEVSGGLDIDATKFTITGQGGATRTLSTTNSVDRTSTTEFTLTIAGADKTAVDALLNQNGTSSVDATTYNLAAAADWCTNVAGGADASNGITVNNVTPFIYVDASKADNSGSGRSWANAKKSLQAALDIAISGDQIWVAKGTYNPSSAYDLTNTSRYYHFRMKQGVEIYGGFAGTESAVSQRTDFGEGGANETILSGDLNDNDNFDVANGGYQTTTGDDNCYHVFYHPDGVGLTNSAVLDGFTVKGGNANDGLATHISGGGFYNEFSSPTLNRIVIINNFVVDLGGGIYNLSSSPSLNNVTVAKNLAGVNGAGIVNSLSNPTLTNVKITNNNTTGFGGGIYNGSASPSLNNVTIANNSSDENGGGIYEDNSTSTLNNCIVWGNTSLNPGHQIYLESGTITLNNSCYSNGANDVQNFGGTFTPDVNCITSDPEFVDAANDDFTLFGTSPCVDAGSDGYNSQSYDIRGAGFGRKLNKTNGAVGTIDMGAYEYKFGTDPASNGPDNPSSFTATVNSSSQIDLSWVLNGDTDPVLVAFNTTGTFDSPTNGQTYTSGNDFGSGRETVIYAGGATSNNHTGLTPGTRYYYKIWSQDGSNNYSSGDTEDEWTLPVTPDAPTVANTLLSTTLTVAVNGGTNGSGTVYLIRETTTGNYLQAGGSLDVGEVWATAASWGTKTVTGLSPNTNYTFEVKARNVNSTPDVSEYSSTASKYTLANVPSAMTFVSHTTSSVDLQIVPNSNPAGTEYAIYNGSEYLQANGTFAGTEAWQTEAQWEVTSGNLRISGLTDGTAYDWQAKARNGDDTETAFSTALETKTLPSEASNVSFSNVAATTFDISWTRGSGDGVKVFLKQTDAGSSSPVDGTNYGANAAFTSGDEIGTTGWYCVYSGAGTSVNVTNVDNTNHLYTVHVVEYVSFTGNNFQFNTASTTSTAVSIATPSEQASNIQFSNITRTGMTVRWAKGDGDGSLLLAKEKYRIATNPLADGIIYDNPNTNYTSAPTVGGAKLLYNGTDANPSINVTGLTRYKLYYFRAFAYNNAAAPYYLQTENATNPRSRWTLRRDGLMEEDLTLDAEYAYPNPASNSISTTLDMFEAGTVSAKLYDAAGRVVAELYNQSLPFGTHELKFDISNVPSGVYQLIISKGSEAIIYPVSVVK